MTTSAPTQTCSCGIPMTNGQCIHHCDRPQLCPVACPPCLVRDSICPICRTNCGSPTARIHHETECRRAESQQARKDAA